MPSSLIFAALAAAWLVVLVPMFARRRQEVARTTDAALAARVVRRGSDRSPVASGAPRTNRVEEAFPMPDTDRGRAGVAEGAGAEPDFDADQEDGQWRQVHSDDVRAGRRYRPGRGGFDPEAAALAARAKYARRQRLVLGMLAAALVTGVAGVVVSLAFWSAHVAVDLVLVGYLTYLRRQVRIEEDIRHRRLSRLSSGQDVEDDVDADEYVDDDEGESYVAPVRVEANEGPVDDRRGDPRAAPHLARTAVALDIDDEDPMFDELDERTWEPYRRAVGE